MSRRTDLYPIIRRLREEDGLTWAEISDRLGVARQTAHDYYRDPTGERHRARQEKYRPKDFYPCERCDGQISGSAYRHGSRRCYACRRKQEQTAVDLRIDDVAEMYREGMSQREIAKALGYGPNSHPPELTEARRRGLIGYRYKAYEDRAA